MASKNTSECRVSQNQRIFILNNVCGPLTSMGKALKQLGHQVAFFEADPNGCRDLEQAKTAISQFNPDVILQQNFNVYMLSGDFGGQLLDWIESSGFKQAFWFLTRPECLSERHTFEKWVEQGYFKSANFLCVSEAMSSFFTDNALKASFLPVAIEAQTAQPIADTSSDGVISYFSNTFTGHPNSPVDAVLATLGNQEPALRYFMQVITSYFPAHDPQTIIGYIIKPVRRFFSSIDINFFAHQRKRQVLEKELQHLPMPLVHAVLHQVEFVYTDYVSCAIHQQIKPLIQHTGGSAFWDAVAQSAPRSGVETACQLDNPTFKPGTVVTFSPFLTMTAPSSAPLAVIASGNQLICQYSPELSELVPDEYVLSYKSIDALIGHIEQVNENKADLSEQKAAAQAHVLAHHTYQQRAQQLLDLL
ncbi:MAG: hypothetical protein ACI8WB_005317 [Phenylobacterium sp.]|jgi:hypothetical protein